MISELGVSRLRDVVSALQAAEENEKLSRMFSMAYFGYSADSCTTREIGVEDLIPHGCGAPACALGHYAYQHFGESDFPLKLSPISGEVNWANGSPLRWDEVGTSKRRYKINEWFDLSGQDVDRLFGTYGCGGATSPKEAADYIERFIAEKQKK